MVAIRSLSVLLTYLISLCGVIPLFAWLPTAPRVILVLGFLSGIWQDRKDFWPLKPWMLNVSIVPFFLYYSLQFSRSNPIQPVVSLLTIMLAVRLCGEKTVRHSLQIQVISLFCLASSSLFDLSPLFLVYLGVMLFLISIALVLTTFVTQDSKMSLSKLNFRKVLISGSLIPLFSLPLMLFLFPLLPRTQLPLWNYLSYTAGLTTGLSDKVDPGSQNNIGQSTTLAFRVEMPRQSQQIYWRGTVFNQIEGNRWVRNRAVPAEESILTGRKVGQTIYPEPTDSKVLIALDKPSSISLKWFKRSHDGVFESFGPARKRLNYSAESVVNEIGMSGGLIDKSFYLLLPNGIPSRIQQLAADVKRSGKDDRGRLELLEVYFRNGKYRYSTSELPTGDRALESFLFETRRGHCEFFASAFAMLLRSAGVPSRLVGGYLGGDYSELGGYYLVTENMAHVWVEAYIEGSGWLRIDPSSFAENAGNVFGADKSIKLLLRLRLTLDFLNHVWNRTVIPFDLESQLDLAGHAGKRFQSIDFGKTARSIIKVTAVILLILGLIFVAKRRLLFHSREERILKDFLLRAEPYLGSGRDLRRMGLFEIAEVSDNRRVKEFVDIYAGTLYRDRKLTDEEYRQLRKILKGGFDEIPN